MQIDAGQVILKVIDIKPLDRELSLPLQPTSSDELIYIERAIKGDRRAFTSLYDQYVNRVYRHVFYWVRSQADAEDITQEVFVRAWKSMHKYKITGAPIVSWFTAIARNLVNDHFRARKRLVPLDEAAEVPCGEGDDPEVMAEIQFDRSQIKDCILKLKKEKQKVIVMRFIDGLSYSEVAKALKKSEGAVRVLQYRALKDLKEILSDKGL